jgi:hypothetical protein
MDSFLVSYPGKQLKMCYLMLYYTIPYGTSSGSDNFQNNQNSDPQNSRSDKNHSKS